jgi:hypothetical protein
MAATGLINAIRDFIDEQNSKDPDNDKMTTPMMYDPVELENKMSFGIIQRISEKQAYMRYIITVEDKGELK